MPVPLDFKDALLAPEFLDCFQVIRRQQNVDSNGRISSTNSLAYNARGIVTPFTPDSLRREPDMQMEYKALSIVTTFILRGPSLQQITNNLKLPDIIVWNKDQYLITSLDDYSNYSPGFVKVVAISQDYVDYQPSGLNT